MRRLLIAAMLCLACHVSPATPAAPAARRHVAAADVVAAARHELDAHLGADGAHASVSVIGSPEDIDVPGQAVTLKAHRLTGRWPRSRVGVAVDIRVDEQVVRTATVWFALEVRQPVLTYAQDASPGVPAGQLHWVSRELDVAGMQGAPVTDPAQLQGVRLRRSVLADAPAMVADFERVPDVDRQQRVEVIATVGAVRLRTHGVASKQGAPGDVIPVMVDGAETPVAARVIDKGAVEVVQ
ncbi:flagella basal body P-ring formation protein FlgA [Dyella solisilvae]|uniref:Flagella basal body P-ring formation protein FlgA n=1 Tax=Dyella solisilvae TaxID=1920168 RepID=A0A370K9K1_9GAMM|nr:flagellar basal body P-ring formation chaperone FlgA [Dyella solisilvae]RDI99324.1 flagella basal body P-ring formation protein FlgA [Dyella solisilvae]